MREQLQNIEQTLQEQSVNTSRFLSQITELLKTSESTPHRQSSLW